jgi:hypothetical protein
MSERFAAAGSVTYRTELPRRTFLSNFPVERRGEKFFGSLHIFLASKVNIRILHDANSLQVCAD